MKLKINGKPREVEGVSTVEELIARLDVHRTIVVEHNGKILQKEQYAAARLADDDVLEILHMVGGG